MIWIAPGLTGNELDVVIVHEIVHAVAGPGHTQRFIARLRRAAEAARGQAALASALRTEADDLGSTLPMRARDVYADIEAAAWQGAPLRAVAAALGLTLAEMLGRYPRARREYERARGQAAVAMGRVEGEGVVIGPPSSRKRR